MYQAEYACRALRTTSILDTDVAECPQRVDDGDSSSADHAFVTSPGILFFSGGLVLPSGGGEYPKNLDEYFRKDGKWGVLALAVYNVVGSVGNVLLFDYAVFSRANFLNVAGIAVVALVVGSSRGAVQSAATLLFGVVLAITWALAIPTPY